MLKPKHPRIMSIIALLLIIVISSPFAIFANAADTTSTRASDYLNSYNSYIYNAAFGKIQIWFDVTGVHYMDEIGALTVKVYESTDNSTWTWVKTYKHDTTSGMLGENKVYYSSHVDYQGTIGRYYKAYVTIWAGKDGSGDSRYLWTNVQKATLFAG